jgi:hypothetical protein
VTTLRMAGIVAVLSPRISWELNKAAALAVVDDVTTPDAFTLGTAANVGKARRILAGERPLRVLSGPKVRAFYRAIRGDVQSAVVDGWMLKATGFHRDTCSNAQYVRVATALVLAAEAAGTDVTTFQATVWLHVRGGGGE